MRLSKKFISVFLIVALVLQVVASVFAPVAHSATAGVDEAYVSLTFDDSLISTYTKAAPILKSKNLPGVLYANTGYHGKTGYMTWAQVKDIQDTYKWEVGSHSVTHPLMTTLSDTKLKYEVEQSYKDLVSHGINVYSFATPFGDYNNKVKSAISKYFGAHRPFHDRQYSNVWPYDNYLIYVRSVEQTTTIDEVKAWIDDAKANKTWVVLVFHDIVSGAPADQYEYSTTGLQQIVDYIAASGVKCVTVKDVLDRPITNLLPSLENGIGNGWTVDNKPVYDTNGYGNAPTPKTSIRIEGSTKASHLYSPMIAVSANTVYGIKAFTDMSGWSKGEFGYYIDEFDAQGNWISGRWLNGYNGKDVFMAGFRYQPTSWNVAKARLQIYRDPNSSGKVYVDSIQWFAQYTDTTMTPPPSPTPVVTASPSPAATASPTASASVTPVPTASASATPRPTATATPSATPVPTATASATPKPTATVTPTPSATPVPTPTASPTPSPVNLVKNGSFEVIENGWAQSWSRDNATTVTLNTQSKGNNGVASVQFVPSTNGKHLFSENIAVVTGKNYTWKSWASVSTGSGEFGFYIDEYDANGNWISGQWKGALYSTYSGPVSISYTPSSSSVKSAGLQYYVDPNTTFSVTVDSVELY